MEAYLGQIRIFAGDFAPSGWSLCDGSTLNISGNEALFALIGTTYGGNGSTNFKLPDLRGRLPLHFGKGPSTSTPTTYTIGQTVGVESVTITEANLPAHTHTVNATQTTANQTSPMGNPLLGTTASAFYELSTSSGFATVAFNNAALQPAPGGGTSHDNNMPALVLNYIICTVGLYPDLQ
ncbi:phage tail protein [Undibacterium squillarum]|uniref:Microcystin dependent protein n=1 Tax=Undibacterium squillarum TaxID=1131567 RepID=A0ABQ2XXQ4_9BURK|nr:tail fiber protein [Undibacterium squillarum]GGX36112.1 microcystin dependent protein [Undibacterium squillarum]